jgi:DNA-directed RNA polymerase subunit H (RpoH/RPB5)
MAKRKSKLAIKHHILIPKHVKLSVKEREWLFKNYNISLKELPKMKKDDPAIVSLHAKEGDVIKIVRQSPTAGEIEFYRGIVSE